MTPRHAARRAVFVTIATLITVITGVTVATVTNNSPSAYQRCEAGLRVTLAATADNLSQAYAASRACASLTPQERANAASVVLDLSDG